MFPYVGVFFNLLSRRKKMYSRQPPIRTTELALHRRKKTKKWGKSIYLCSITKQCLQPNLMNSKSRNTIIADLTNSYLWFSTWWALQKRLSNTSAQIISKLNLLSNFTDPIKIIFWTRSKTSIFKTLSILIEARKVAVSNLWLNKTTGSKNSWWFWKKKQNASIKGAPKRKTIPLGDCKKR